MRAWPGRQLTTPPLPSYHQWGDEGGPFVSEAGELRQEPPERSSKYGAAAAPFGANLAFSLLRCPAGGGDREEGEGEGERVRHLVRVRLNERTVALPGPGTGGQWCAAGVDCTLAELRALAAAARARYNATCDLDLDEVLAAPPPSAALLAAAGRAATGLRDAGAMALGGVWGWLCDVKERRLLDRGRGGVDPRGKRPT